MDQQPSTSTSEMRFVVRELAPRCFVVDDTATGLSYDMRFTQKGAEEAAAQREFRAAA